MNNSPALRYYLRAALESCVRTNPLMRQSKLISLHFSRELHTNPYCEYPWPCYFQHKKPGIEVMYYFDLSNLLTSYFPYFVCLLWLFTLVVFIWHLSQPQTEVTLFACTALCSWRLLPFNLTYHVHFVKFTFNKPVFLWNHDRLFSCTVVYLWLHWCLEHFPLVAGASDP